MRGLTTLEYVSLIIIFVGAFLGMQNYFRRAVQANWKSNMDSFCDEQYEYAGRNPTQENVGELKIVNSTLITKISNTSFASTWNFTQKVGLALVEVPGWGRYKDEKKHEGEEEEEDY